MAWSVDQEELLVRIESGVVGRAVFIGAGGNVDGERTFDCEGGLGGVGECCLSTLELGVCRLCASEGVFRGATYESLY